MIRLNPLFADGMILQREKEIHIWGGCDPEDSRAIRVTFDGRTVDAVRSGCRWDAVLPAREAAVGLSMTVCCGEEKLELHDISVGDVWVAGGQSNMEYYLKYEQQVMAGHYPEYNDQIRFYDVPEVAWEGQEKRFDYSQMSVWRRAVSREDLDYFSAVGFYFAQRIYEKEQVPVGILGCNWGGTAILAWMNPESAERAGKPWCEEVRRTLAGMDMEKYYRLQDRNPANDTGNPMTAPFTVFMVPVTRTDEEAAKFQAEQEAVKQTEALIAEGLPVDGNGQPLQPQQIPGSLYENMVKRISDFPVKGVLYYQGESDDSTPFGPGIYDRMLSAMIDDWRALWKDEMLPFFVVQLAPFRHWMGIDAADYVTLRQKQKAVADRKENVWLASVGDVGMEWDIHPKDKKTVGERLALLALGHTYGHGILCEAPAVRKAVRTPGGVRLEFDHGDGLHADASKELPLQIVDRAGNPAAFTYEISGDALEIALQEEKAVGVVEAPEEAAGGMAEVAERPAGGMSEAPEEDAGGVAGTPECAAGSARDVKVRLGWSNWYVMNLYNSAGLPAFPFESGWL